MCIECVKNNCGLLYKEKNSFLYAVICNPDEIAGNHEHPTTLFQEEKRTMSAAHKSERPVTVERPCTTCGKRFITKSDSREKLCPDCKDSFEPTVDGFFGQPILTPTKGQGHMAGFLGQLGRLIPIPGLIPMRDKTYRKGAVKTTKRKKRK